MKAIICQELGTADKLVLAEMEEPRPGPGEVLFDVHAAALNFPDTLIISGQYQLRPALPFVPGGEAAGVVLQVGAGVTEFKPGDRIISTGALGAFAERQCKPVSELTHMPDSMPFNTGAALLITYGTSYYALKQCAGLQAGESLVVLGAAGGVGLAAVDLGVAMGGNVIAAASSEEKLDVACAMGAQQRINYGQKPLKDEIKTLTAGQGADVVYDPVGGEISEQALRATAWNGRFLVIGFASGTIPKIPLNLILLKNNAIKGVFYGAWMQRDVEAYKQNIAELFEMFGAGKINPLVSRVFSVEQFAEAFAQLTERRAVGKVVLTLKD